MKLDFEKMGGLIPAIVQDYNTNKVLMLGFMNEEAYEETKATGKVTFFNRMAQKVGEEAVETVIEATNGTDDRLVYEAADMIYHLIVLLTSKGLRIEDLARELKSRHKG